MSKLTGEETIRDIVSSLGNAEKYTRGVLENMAEFRRQGLDSVVRIGTTGEGIYPFYRLDPVDSETLGAMDNLSQFLEEMAIFNGRNHKRMEWTAHDIRGENWSVGEMAFEEVQALLGELRKFRRSRQE
jgi:hypothetical protein